MKKSKILKLHFIKKRKHIVNNNININNNFF